MASTTLIPADNSISNVKQTACRMAAVVFVICLIPITLNLLGVDFGTQGSPFDIETVARLSVGEQTDAMFHSLRGSYTHTLLEWSAFCTAIFTVMLAFVVFRIKGDVTTPIIAIALFWAGCMDAFHTLAADRLIEATADNKDLIPFTWAICRAFNALIGIAGVAVVLARGRRKRTAVSNFTAIALVSVVFGYFAYGVIHYCAVSDRLPKTMFPDSLVTRPWDMIALVLFVINAGFFLLLYRRIGGVFAAAMLVSAIPDIATQLHMAFGSTSLFDNHFNIAHFLKIVTYLVPFLGLSIDYITTYTQEQVLAKNLTVEVAERKRAEVALRESEGEIRAVLETAPNAILTINHRGIIQSINPAGEDIFGYTSQELIGRNVKTLMPSPYHEEHDGYLEAYLRTGEKKIIGMGREVLARRKNGEIFPMDLAVGEYSRGDETYFTGFIQDITDRKEVEEALAQRAEELEQSNKELDDFAYIASHDLKEPLRGIHNYATFLIEDYSDKIDDDGVAKLQTLQRLTQRMENLIDTLLKFSRVGRVDMAFEETDLNQVLGEVMESLQVTLEQDSIDVRTPNPLPTVQCDRARIGEVFRNLVTNAMKYNDKSDKWIEVGVLSKRESGESGGGDAAEGRHVFYVRDNGIGIPEKHQESIFRIFKRLHGREKFGGGTGAGLTIVKKIVERHGGLVWIESTQGEGTTFKFTLGKAA